MQKCWAHSRGNCSPRLASVQAGSRSLLEQRIVVASGFSWCSGSHVLLGANSLTRRHLCQAHHAHLTEVDIQGSAVVRALQLLREQDSRHGALTSSPVSLHLSGNMFERWLLKLGLSLAWGDPLLGCSDDASLSASPISSLMDLVFGKTAFTQRIGLYWGARLPLEHVDRALILAAPVPGRERFEAFWFCIHGYVFLLSLVPAQVLEIQIEGAHADTVLEHERSWLYRERMSMIGGAPGPMQLHFNWTD